MQILPSPRTGLLSVLAAGVVLTLTMFSAPANAASPNNENLTLSGVAANSAAKIIDDPVCDAALANDSKSTQCSAEMTAAVGKESPATIAQISGNSALVSTSGSLTLAEAAATRRIYTRTWTQQMRGLYYVNWTEKHSGRIYFDKAGHVWSTTKKYGYKGNHICGQGSGILYSVVVKHCTVENRYDLSRPAISQWDYFQVHVIWKGIPIYKSHKMHTNAYDSGKITFL